jgi:hypothetical protein
MGFVKWCVVLAMACYQPRTLVGDVTNVDASRDGVDSDAAVDGPPQQSADADAAACALRTWSLFDGTDPTQDVDQPPDGIKDWIGSGFSPSEVTNFVWHAPIPSALATNPGSPAVVQELHAAFKLGTEASTNHDSEAGASIDLSGGPSASEHLRITLTKSMSGTAQDIIVLDAVSNTSLFGATAVSLGVHSFDIAVIGTDATISVDGGLKITQPLATVGNGSDTRTQFVTTTGDLVLESVTISTCP